MNIGHSDETIFAHIYSNFYATFDREDWIFDKDKLKKIKEESKINLDLLKNKEEKGEINFYMGKYFLRISAIGYEGMGFKSQGRFYLNFKTDLLCEGILKLVEELTNSNIWFQIKATTSDNLNQPQRIDKCVLFYEFEKINNYENILKAFYNKNPHYFNKTTIPFGARIINNDGTLLNGIARGDSQKMSYGVDFSHYLQNFARVLVEKEDEIKIFEDYLNYYQDFARILQDNQRDEKQPGIINLE